MCFEKHSHFVRTILGSLLGALIGIGSGLVFGLLIGFIARVIGTSGSEVGMMMRNGPLNSYETPAFLGMAFGAIIGSLLGGFSANKK